MRKKFFTALVLASALLLTACGSSGSSMKTESAISSDGYYNGYAEEEYYPEAPMEFSQDAASSVAADEVMPDQKIITTYSYDVETRSYDEFIPSLTEKISQFGGYVESSNEWSYGSNNRSCDFTIRIPQAKMRGFLGEIEANSNVVRRSTDTENVTLQYVDLESHIKALKTEEETLLGLMEKAEKLEDVLTIQSELTNVRYQLQSFESQRRSLENKINYDTLYLSINEVERETTVITKPSFWEEVSVGFSDNIYELVQGIRGLAIWFLSNIISIVIFVVVVVIVVKFIKKRRVKKQDK